MPTTLISRAEVFYSIKKWWSFITSKSLSKNLSNGEVFPENWHFDSCFVLKTAKTPLFVFIPEILWLTFWCNIWQFVFELVKILRYSVLWQAVLLTKWSPNRRIILVKGKLATINYDSTPRPQSSCFAHPIIHRRAKRFIYKRRVSSFISKCVIYYTCHFSHLISCLESNITQVHVLIYTIQVLF